MLLTAALHYDFCANKTDTCNNKLSITLVKNLYLTIKLNKSLICICNLLRKLNSISNLTVVEHKVLLELLLTAS